MSYSPPPSNDPYLPPKDYAPSAPPSSTRRPGGLTAIAVIALILGILGLLGATLGIAGQIFSKQLADLTKGSQQGTSKEMQELQAEMQAVMDDFRVANIADSVIQFPISLALLIGGIKVLGLKSGGRSLLALACGAALIFEIARGILAGVIQFRTMQVMNEGMDRVASSKGGEQFVTIMQASMFVGLGCAAIMVVAKLVFYALSLMYLKKQEVRALFPN